MYLGKRTNDFSRDTTEKTTQRVHIMSEILTAIKLIKFYAWEAPFSMKIDEIRVIEMSLIYNSMINKSINYTVVFAIPVLAALSSLSMFVGLGNKLTASRSFVILSVYNTLRYPFFMLPMAVKATAGALTSFARLNLFFQLDEVIPLLPTPAPDGCDLAFKIEDSDFKWDGAESSVPTLAGISLNIKKGAKVAVVGSVGCGKSSILAALLGQIRQVKGDKIKMYGTTAYMSQEAWLLNLTLRDNITFGKEYNAERYKEVIRVCGLQRDLTLLLSGDRTEIAERGANLSGGQRQRVSLARSVYFDADILLLDDPLSAVDQHVGRHIFEECFKSNLKDKTVILVMNQLNYLCQMDYVVYVEDGKIKSQGTFDELMAKDKEFEHLVSSHVVSDDANEEDSGEPLNHKEFDPDNLPPSPIPLDVEKQMIHMNSLSITNREQLQSLQRINEHTVRSMIEKQQNTSITGAEVDHDIARIVARNEYSVLSTSPPILPLHPISEAEEDEAAIRKGRLVVDDESAKATGLGDFLAYARVGSGTTTTISTVLFFIFVHCIRIGGDFWLRLWVPRVGDFTDGIYIGGNYINNS
jgi:ABC-type multidrug transport system ATPase subunit